MAGCMPLSIHPAGSSLAECITSVVAEVRGLAIKKLREIKRFSLVGMFNACLAVGFAFVLQALTGNPVFAIYMAYSIGASLTYFPHTRYSFKAATC